MIKCQCSRCSCPNEVKKFGHRYEEENALVEAEYNKDSERLNQLFLKFIRTVKEQHIGESQKISK